MRADSRRPYIFWPFGLCESRYQSQIDGLWRFAAPSSFFPCLWLALGRSTFGPPQQKEEDTMTIGTVKFFNNDKGYGFITPDDGGQDAFVHISAVQGAGLQTLNQNQRVSFELETGRNGRTSAINLQSQD
jgi:CspA family cold shock protein